MPRLIDLQYTIAGALAAGAMLTAPAIAKPMPLDAHTPSHSGTASPRQDLRGEYAMDAARGVVGPYMPKRQDLRGEYSRDAAVGHFAPTAPVGAARTAGDDGDGNVWRILGFGLAGMGVAVGSAAGLARHQRVRARRVVA